MASWAAHRQSQSSVWQASTFAVSVLRQRVTMYEASQLSSWAVTPAAKRRARAVMNFIFALGGSVVLLVVLRGESCCCKVYSSYAVWGYLSENEKEKRREERRKETKDGAARGLNINGSGLCFNPCIQTT